MSRIGLQPVEIPENVEINFEGSVLNVKGPNGEISRQINSKIELKIEDDLLTVERKTDDKEARSLHGLTRSLIDSMVEGVANNFEKTLEMEGVGYRANKQGNKVILEVGYSHPVEIEAPEGIDIEVEDGDSIIVRGSDKQLVGEVAAKIRAIREPEPYKGKGIRYKGEYIRRKEGKTGVTATEE